jgi:hypothetical protein
MARTDRLTLDNLVRSDTLVLFYGGRADRSFASRSQPLILKRLFNLVRSFADHWRGLLNHGFKSTKGNNICQGKN